MTYTNPDPVEVSKEIRRNLRRAGIPSRSVSVVTGQSFVIKVKTKRPGVDLDAVYLAALYAYHCHKHAWLIVKVDYMFLPMPGFTCPTASSIIARAIDNEGGND